MATIVRCGAAVIGLFVASAGIAAESSAYLPRAVPKNAVPTSAIDSLMARLESISHDRDMTTAKKAIVATEAIEKFNQQYKGKPLIVRLKVQDVAANAEGQCLTANHPDLPGVQLFTGKFQANLSNAEVMSVTKESVLVLTGVVSASSQPKTLIRSSEVHKPGNSIAFALHTSQACQICLDNISYQLEGAAKTRLAGRPSSANGGETLADKAKNEQSRSVDDIKLFFLKGILQGQHQSGSTSTGVTAKAGTSPSPGSNTRLGYGNGLNSTSGSVPAKVKRNRIYTVDEIMQKFGTPASRSSKATAEEWVFKCKDGVVHVHFTQAGFVRSFSTTKPDTLKLEIKSVDSSSSNRSY